MIPVLHLVTDDRVLADPALPERARAALEAGGPRLTLHLRGPGTAGRTLLERGRTLLALARTAGCPLLVNDRVDVALLLGADGAHLPGRGLPVAVARRLLPAGSLVGRSVHGSGVEHDAGSRAAEDAELDDRPDFLLAGTIYSTPSHPGRPGAGPARIASVRKAHPGVPVLGIGGITPDRVGSVLEAGGHGVAVLRGIWDAPDPARAVAAFLRELDGNAPATGTNLQKRGSR